MADPLLHVSDLCFSYGRRAVLRNLSLTLAKGEKIALAGPNGSGKTTFFRCLTGLEKIASGQILLSGRKVDTEADFQELRRVVGYSVQNAEDQLIFPTVLEDVSFGPLNLGLEEPEAKARQILAVLGLKGKEDWLTHQLSGGQQKLVALAAVLVMEPRILLLDEPFNGLDAAACGRLSRLLGERDCAMIVVAHDPEHLRGLCQRRLAMEDGALVSADAQEPR